MKNQARFMVVWLALVSSSLFVWGGADLPFTEGFESYAVGTAFVDGALSNFFFSGQAAVVTNSPAAKDGSTNILYSFYNMKINMDTEALDFHTNVWWSSYVQITPRAHDETGTYVGLAVTDAAIFFVTDAGALVARSNETWVTVNTGLQTNGWMRFAVQLDFKSELYNIYHVGGGPAHGANLVLQNSGGALEFSNGYPGVGAGTNELRQVEIDGTTSVDTVLMTSGKLQPIATGVGLTNVKLSQEQPDEIMLSNLISGGSLRHFGTNTMAGAFGNALASALKTGDQVGFYDASAADWVTLTANGSGGWSAGTPSAVSISPTTGIWLKFVDTEPRVARYSMAFTSETTHAAAGTTTIYPGWNLLSLPFTAGNMTLSGMALPGAVGDIVAVNLGGNSYDSRVFNSGWRPNASINIPAGSGFWYYRNTNAVGNATWNSHTL